jgi:glutamyl/glutaminyl-tRNA synthetase
LRPHIEKAKRKKKKKNKKTKTKQKKKKKKEEEVKGWKRESDKPKMLFIIIRFKIQNPEQNPWLWFIWGNIKESSSILEPPPQLYPPPPPPPPPFPRD